MKNEINTTPVYESTYALLMRSEERPRGFFEAVVYALFILSAVTAIWQFAQQPITVPAGGFRSADATTKSAIVRS